MNKLDHQRLQAYPQINLSLQLLQHHKQMLQFLFYTEYDIVYETFQLNHLAYNGKNNGKVTKKFKSEEIHRHFQMISERLHIRIARDDNLLDKQLGKLQTLWHSNNIPYFHRYYFEKYLFTAYFKSYSDLLKEQYELIKGQNHPYFIICRAINARQSCLRQLKKLLADLKPEDIYQYIHLHRQKTFIQSRKNEIEKYKQKGYKIQVKSTQIQGNIMKTKMDYFSDNFNHLTKLTLYVIDLIMKWKQYIRSLTHDQRKQRQRIEYYFYDDNYFLKILNDLGFLKVSFLNNFYHFAPKNDPFMFECILHFEKNSEKAIQDEILKKIFIPKKQKINEIIQKLQILSTEYKNNIRSRKSYNLDKIKKITNFQKYHQKQNNPPEPKANLILHRILKPLQKKSKSLKSFLIKENNIRNKNGQIIVQLQKKSPRKRITSIPALPQRMIIQRLKDSRLKNSTIIDQNPVNQLRQQIDEQLLQVLKKEVIKKVKKDFQHPEIKSKDPTLQLYIDSKVQDAMKSIFPYSPQKQVIMPIQFKPIQLKESQMISQVAKMYKRSINRFYEMQLSQTGLLNAIQSSPYCYFIHASIGNEQIGRIICTLDNSSYQYKKIKILHIAFYDVSTLETLMIKFVEFLEQYENAYEIIFIFQQPINQQYICQLLNTLQSNLSIKLNLCLVATKQMYSHTAEIRFIFKRKTKNINYIPNFYPNKFFIEMCIVCSNAKILIEHSTILKYTEQVDYDFLLMNLLNKVITSENLILLKENVKWKNRLSLILEQIRYTQQNKIKGIELKMYEAHNICDINKQMLENKKKLLQLSDIKKKGNNIKTFYFNLQIQLPFSYKCLKYKDNQPYYRYEVMRTIKYWVNDEGVHFYLIPIKDKQDWSIILFHADSFIRQNKVKKIYLSEYLQLIRIRQPQNQMQLQYFWIPMSRFPAQYNERQDLYLPIRRIDDLQVLGQDLFIGESFQHFCNIQMQNSIQYAVEKHDYMLKKPYGFAIFARDRQVLIHSRIVS